MPHIIPPYSAAWVKGYKFLRVFAEYHIAREETINLYVEGGVSPYDWECNYDEYTLGAAQTAGQTNTVTASASALEDHKEHVTITDAAGTSVEILVCVCDPTDKASSDCCADGPAALTFDDGSTPDAIASGGQIDMYILGGCPPYDWTVTTDENGISLDIAVTGDKSNILISDGSCLCGGTGNITIGVTDLCESYIEFTINATITAVDPLEFSDAETEDSIDPSSSIQLALVANTGCGPYDWEITSSEGGHYTLTNAQTTGRLNTLNADECIDAGVALKVTDHCGTEVEFTIDSTISDLEFDDDNTSDTVAAGSFTAVYVTGGYGPYDWEVVGVGYSLNAAQTQYGINILNATSGDCDVDIGPYGRVTCTDACGYEVSFSIALVGGQWVLTEDAVRANGSCTGCANSPPWCDGNPPPSPAFCPAASGTVYGSDYGPPGKWVFSTGSYPFCEKSPGCVTWKKLGTEVPVDYEPPCGHPGPCRDYIGFGTGATCLTSHPSCLADGACSCTVDAYIYSEWQCI